MCSAYADARPLPLCRCGANRQAIAWPWLMAPRKKAARAATRDSAADVEREPTWHPRSKRSGVLENGIPAISWRTLAGVATLVGLLLIGIKAVTYTNNLAHSITTLADAVGKLDGTIGTVTSDIVVLKQRMAVYDANEAARQTELTDIQQRQQRIEQAVADLRAAVAAGGVRK